MTSMVYRNLNEIPVKHKEDNLTILFKREQTYFSSELTSNRDCIQRKTCSCFELV